MRDSQTTQNRARDTDIIAQPPLGSGPSFDPKEPLPVSRARVWIGIIFFVVGVIGGFSAALFVEAKLWLGGIGLSLVIASFWILGVHRLRSVRGRGRHPRKLYAHQRI